MIGEFIDACSKSNDTRVLELLPFVDDINAMHNNVTALYMAVAYGKLSTVKILLDNHANPNQLIKYDVSSPLLMAAAHGKLEMVNTLLLRGANPNICNKNGDTALHFSAKFGIADVTLALLKCNANPNILNKNQESPLHAAAIRRDWSLGEFEKNYEQTIEWLFIYGANPFIKNGNNKTAFSLANEAQLRENTKGYSLFRNWDTYVSAAYEKIETIRKLMTQRQNLLPQFYNAKTNTIPKKQESEENSKKNRPRALTQ